MSTETTEKPSGSDNLNLLVRNQFVGSNGDAPTRIHQTMYEAKCANHDFIDVFSPDGFHETSWKRKEDGTYTDDF